MFLCKIRSILDWSMILLDQWSDHLSNLTVFRYGANNMWASLCHSLSSKERITSNNMCELYAMLLIFDYVKRKNHTVRMIKLHLQRIVHVWGDVKLSSSILDFCPFGVLALFMQSIRL